ncbi:hypothetical protein NKG05_22165 [Oerskovia sp. M15]
MGRTATLLADLAVEIGPHGWKLADRSGMDERRAQAFLREDLGALAIAGHGYTGPLAVSVVGPWTLAAELYLAGDRVLADRGATADLAASLAAGLGAHLDDVHRQVPEPSSSCRSRSRSSGRSTRVCCRRSPALAPAGGAGPDIIDGLKPVLDAARAWGRAASCTSGPRGSVSRPPSWRGRRRGPRPGRARERLGREGLGAGRPCGRARHRCLGGPAAREGFAVLGTEPRRAGLARDGPVAPDRPAAAGLDDVTLLAAPRPGGMGLGSGRQLGSTDENRAMLGNLGRVAEMLAERAQD